VFAIIDCVACGGGLSKRSILIYALIGFSLWQPEGVPDPERERNRMSTPEGWYDDSSGRLRWWDGTVWTARYKDGGSAGDGTVWSSQGKPLKGFGGGRYRLTAEYLYFEKGMIGTKAEQIRTREIFDVDMSQALTQKARGVGTITLWVRRADGTTERKELEDIAGYREGVSLLNEICDKARQEFLQRQNTQTVNYAGVPAPTSHLGLPAQTPATTAATVDPTEQLVKLSQLHSQGILTDEEFAAAKAKALGL